MNQKEFYDELLDYFFGSLDLRFKGTLVLKKNLLQHDKFDSNHDEFYYKMYYYTLRDFLSIENQYKIYLDYKDCLGGQRVKKLQEIFSNEHHGCLEPQFTIIHSHESQILQLCDLFIGAIGYKNRKDIEHESEIKNYIIAIIEKHIGHQLDIGTPPWETKFNIFRYSPRNFDVQ